MPCSVETAQWSGSPGLTTTSIGASGGVRVSHERAAVAADLDVGRLGVDGDDLVAGDLELVVVGLRDALDGLSRCRRGPSSGSGRGSRAGRPPADGRRPAGRRGRRSAPRGCRRRCRRRAGRSASRPPSRPAAARNSAGPEPIMIVPSPGSTVTELIAGLACCRRRRAAGRWCRPAVRSRPATAVSVSVGAGAGLARPPRRSPRGPGPRSRTRARDADQRAQANLARPAAISIAPSRCRTKRGSA